MLTWTTATGPEYVKVPVAAVIAGEAVDPTSDSASMCILAETATPVALDWHAATWETDDSGTEPVYLARYLAGPLAAGRYMVWVKIVHSVETIVRPSDLMLVK